MTQKGDGLMSTINEEEFDYQAYMRDHPPDPSKINWGPEARNRRRAAAAQRPTVRVEQELLAQFQALAAPGQSAEQAINQALREWLAAKDFKERIRAELQAAVQQAFIQVGVELPPPQPEKSLVLEEA
jgi:uncharacterized protein (DUF4415 family)